MFCKNCGAELLNGTRFCTYCGQSLINEANMPYTGKDDYLTDNRKDKIVGVYSTGRLVLGIISMVLFIFILSESVNVDDFYTMLGMDEAAGAIGILFSFLFLAAGIIGVCTRNSTSNAGTFTAAGLYWGGAVMTFGTGEAFQDLPIFGGVSLAFGVVFFVAGIKSNRINKS